MNFIIHKQKYTSGLKDRGLLDVSANRLSVELGWPVITPKIGLNRVLSNDNHIIVNYGLTDFGVNSYVLGLDYVSVLNHPNCVKLSSNKLKAFEAAEEWYRGIPIVKFTTDREVASGWIENDKKKVVCRTLLSSTNGKGIVIAETVDQLVNAPLYTEYFPKKWEIRVHIFSYPFCNKLICTQQKRRLTSDNLASRGLEERNKFIRNLDNGYIYSDNIDEELTEHLDEISYSCMDFVSAIGLNFGAVDVVINKNLEYRILEVNSAPGLEGRRVELYRQCFQEFEEYCLNL